MNENQFKMCRIPEWRSAGFTGKGIKIGVQEVNDSTIKGDLPRYKGKVLDPFGVKFSELLDTHAQNVVDVIRLVAPEAEIHMLGSDINENMRYAKKVGLDLYNYSCSGGFNNPESNEIERQAIAAGCFFVCAAGNDGDKMVHHGVSGMAQRETWLSVGAAMWSTWWGVTGPFRAGYSSYDDTGKALDVMGFSDGLQIPSEKFDDGLMGVTGTSFACPWVVGLLALWKQWHKQAKGRAPTFDETMSVVKANTIDMEADGYDQKTGFGLFRLPPAPSAAPAPAPKPTPAPGPVPAPAFDVITFKPGQAVANVNGKPDPLSAPAMLVNGRVMLGMRDIVELAGGSVVSWDPKSQTATVKLPRRSR